MTAPQINVVCKRGPPHNPDPSCNETNDQNIEQTLQRYCVNHRQPREWRDQDEKDDEEDTENEKVDNSPWIARLSNANVRLWIRKRLKHYAVFIEPFNAAAISGIMIS